VVTIRQFFALVGKWPSELPCNDGDTLVVAGLEGCIDLMEPADADAWMKSELLPAILAFQDEYSVEAALVFWMPTGKSRVKMNRATEAYSWVCSAPHSNQHIDLGRILWAGAEADVGRFMDTDCINSDVDGPAWIGLHHPRLS
jgi:hypothetical protein